MRIYEAEDYIETLDRNQLLAMMDRIIRAVADRGYFGDEKALNEINRIIRRKEYVVEIKNASRLFPKEEDPLDEEIVSIEVDRTFDVDSSTVKEFRRLYGVEIEDFGDTINIEGTRKELRFVIKEEGLQPQSDEWI